MNEIEFGHRKLLIKYALGSPARIICTSFGIYLILCGISNLYSYERSNGWPEVIKFAIEQFREVHEKSNPVKMMEQPE